MKQLAQLIFSIAILLFSGTVTPAVAQTMNVRVGNVVYSHAAKNTGVMTFSTSSTLTVEGMVYTVSNATAVSTNVVDGIDVVADEVDDYTVHVTFNGSDAAVVVAGNIAQYLTINITGAHVSIVQSEALQQEVTYTLSGTSSNGSFYMDGEYKANFVFSNLTLTNPTGIAVDIEDGKAIGITLEGSNTLSDGTGGSHNATLYIDGHATVDGTGTLTLNGLTKHALATDEHIVINGGTITVAQAATDGFHINERFSMNGGTVAITAIGDGIDVGFRGVSKGTKDQYERNGFIELNGGALTVKTTGVATKALKADSTIVVANATVTATAMGNAYYDETEADISSASAVKTDGDFIMTSGTLNALATGDGGKGINATGAITISGGKAYVTTIGDLFEYGKLDSKPQGVKSDKSITIDGGEVYVCAGSYDGNATAFKPASGYSFIINGGTIMGIARKKTTVSSSSKQGSTNQSSQTITGGQTVTISGVSYTVPSNYSISKANVVVSKEGM